MVAGSLDLIAKADHLIQIHGHIMVNSYKKHEFMFESITCEASFFDVSFGNKTTVEIYKTFMGPPPIWYISLPGLTGIK